MTDLLNCPHCNGESKICDSAIGRFDEGYAVVCWTCGAKSGHQKTKENAVAAWNLRANPSFCTVEAIEGSGV